MQAWLDVETTVGGLSAKDKKEKKKASDALNKAQQKRRAALAILEEAEAKAAKYQCLDFIQMRKQQKSRANSAAGGVVPDRALGQ